MFADKVFYAPKNFQSLKAEFDFQLKAWEVNKKKNEEAFASQLK